MSTDAADTAILIAGQGAYAPGFFAGKLTPELASMLQAIDRVAAEYGRAGVTRLLSSAAAPGAAELATSDSFTLQLAIFATGVCGYHLAVQQGLRGVVVGHSMGEIAAMTAAGAFSLDDGARLVCHRSEALLAHCAASGGMLALQLQGARATALAQLIGDPGLSVAVLNAPQQTVLAGPAPALDAAAAVAAALQVRATRLTAPFPFHSPMLAAAAEAFEQAIGAVRQHPLRARVYSPAAGGYLRDPQDFKALLVRQLTMRIDFLAAVRELHADGVQRFVECTPGGLTALVRRSVPDVSVPLAADVATSTPSGAATAPAPVGPAARAEGTRPVAVIPARRAAPDLGSVVAQLRELYATTLGYPPEAFTDEADLEADLGIDSLKRAEMLTKVASHFALRDVDDGKLANHQTLSDLAHLVIAAYPSAS